ncbi:MAG: hypothetical protein AAF348_07495 [Bacteroidota bacterium]
MIKLGKRRVEKKSAGDTKAFLKSRYKDITEKELQDTIEHYYGKEKNGNAAKVEPKSSTPKK